MPNEDITPQPTTPDAAMGWTDEQQHAADEFRRYVREYFANPCEGTKYALHMAAEGCFLVGVHPSRVSPEGYVVPVGTVGAIA